MDEIHPDRRDFRTIGEMVAVAKASTEKNVWDHISTGAESGVTLRRNRQSLDRIAFRPPAYALPRTPIFGCLTPLLLYILILENYLQP
jgi:hypothetical protein